VLEASNVDLSTEFANMIVSQRGFEAAARVISVSDNMLQTVTDLKTQ
jgi:flagellar hook protein FlgE